MLPFGESFLPEKQIPNPQQPAEAGPSVPDVTVEETRNVRQMSNLVLAGDLNSVLNVWG